MRTDIQCGALGLTYGADYGEGYYSSANAAVLYHTDEDVSRCRHLQENWPTVWVMSSPTPNARELHPEIRKAGVHVQTVLDRLGSFEALNVYTGRRISARRRATTPSTSRRSSPSRRCTTSICLPRLRRVHHLRSPVWSPTRYWRQQLRSNADHQVYLVIDEFQRMVARNIEYMLQLARSMGVSVILANQTMQDLRTSTADLIPPIEANCRYRQWFAVSSAEDRRRLVESSGQDR